MTGAIAAEQAEALLAAGPVALVTVLATEGSAPRGAGTRMLVTATGLHGTIGGGQLEYRAAEQARAILAHPPGAWRVQDYPLGPLLGQCCGGRVRLLVERLAAADWLGELPQGVTATLEEGRVSRAPAGVLAQAGAPISARGALPGAGFAFAEPGDVPRRPVHLFGAGHVGQAIAQALAPLPFTLGWFDSRPELGALPGVVTLAEEDLAACAAEAPADAAILILTHDHGLDYRLTAAALGGRAAYVGLIGSATKRARFLARLERDGIDAARLVCPIGLPGVSGKEPAVIAVATAAQLLGLRAPQGYS